MMPPQKCQILDPPPRPLYITVSYTFFQYTPSPQCHQANSDTPFP